MSIPFRPSTFDMDPRMEWRAGCLFQDNGTKFELISHIIYPHQAISSSVRNFSVLYIYRQRKRFQNVIED
jgi:hypothetical protein